MTRGQSTVVSAPKTSKKAEIAKQGYTKVTDERILEILGYMEKGLSERAACRAVEVNHSTFRQALARYQVATQYARALEVQAEAQIQAIEDTIDKLERAEIDPQTARVIIDTRKWFASKLLPRKYGDKLDLTSDGKQLPAPLLGSVTVQNIDEPKELPE